MFLKSHWDSRHCGHIHIQTGRESHLQKLHTKPQETWTGNEFTER